MRRLILFALLLLPGHIFAATDPFSIDRSIINAGTIPGDLTGDSPFIWARKDNTNSKTLFDRTDALNAKFSPGPIGTNALLNAQTNKYGWLTNLVGVPGSAPPAVVGVDTNRWNWRTALQLNSPINVTWFGATGDGVTDDTAAITNALATAGTQSGGVWFPPGTYLVGTLMVPSGVTIDGLGTLKRKPESAVSHCVLAFGSVSNCVVRGITIDGNLENQTLGYQDGPCGIKIWGTSQNIRLDGITTISNKCDGVYIGGAGLTGATINQVTLLNVNSHRNGRNGLSITAGSQIQVIGGKFNEQISTDPGNGIDIEPDYATDICRDITLSDVQIVGNAGTGFSCGGAPNGTNLTQGWITAAGLVVKSNGHGNGGYGVNLYGMRHLRLAGQITDSGSSGLGITRDLVDVSWDGVIELNKNDGVELALAPTQVVGVTGVSISGMIRNNSQNSLVLTNHWDGIRINATQTAGVGTNEFGTHTNLFGTTNVTINASIVDDQAVPTQRYGVNNFDGIGVRFFDRGSFGNISGAFFSPGEPFYYQVGNNIQIVGGALAIGTDLPEPNSLALLGNLRMRAGIIDFQGTNFLGPLPGGIMRWYSGDVYPSFQLNGANLSLMNVGISTNADAFIQAAVGKKVVLLPNYGSDGGTTEIHGATEFKDIAVLPNNTWLHGHSTGATNIAAIGIDSANQVNIAVGGQATVIGGPLKMVNTPGLTTNINVIVAGGTTNQLQFTYGVLTGNVPQ